RFSRDWSSDVCSSDLEDFAKKAPGLDWTAFFKAAQLDGATKFDAYHANAIPRIAALVNSEPLDAWKVWLVFHQINQNTAVLPTRSEERRVGKECRSRC